MKKVLVLGSSSFTGHYICERMNSEFNIIKVNRSGEDSDLKFDAIHDHISVLEEAIDGIDVVINCISNGDVDSCEKDPEFSKSINYDFVEKLCAMQKKYNFHLIHFSSNAVYNGEEAPYSENSTANAINIYGEIKLKADQFIEQQLTKYTVLRPITMYGVRLGDQRHNPFSFFYEQLLQDKDIVAVDDVYTNMLHVEDLTKCVRSVVNSQIYGTYNISGDDVVNRFEFVSMIRALVPNSKSDIKRVTSDQFKTAAKRPRNTSFDNTAMKEVLGVYPENLNVILQSLVSESQFDKDVHSRCA